MTKRIPNIQYAHHQVDKVFQELIMTDIDLKNHFDDYLFKEYKGENSERLNYFDIGEIGKQIVANFKYGKTETFKLFFDKVEDILSSCDKEVENLIVVGLFESIQNCSGEDVNYYVAFNKWLNPNSKTHWNNLIEFWENKD